MRLYARGERDREQLRAPARAGAMPSGLR
jgi:hypothetical protein